MEISSYIKQSFKITLLKFISISVFYYIYFIIATIILNMILSPIMPDTKDSINPFDFINSVIVRYNMLTMDALMKFYLAIILGIFLLVSICIFLDAANRGILLATIGNEKLKFNYRFYFMIGNMFMKRFILILLFNSILLTIIYMFSYFSNSMLLTIFSWMDTITPVIRYSFEIIIATAYSAVSLYLFFALFILFNYLPTITIIENSTFKNTVKKVLLILRSPSLFIKFTLFNLLVMVILSAIFIACLSVIALSISIPILYPIAFILYLFSMIFIIIFNGATSLVFYINQGKEIS